MIASRSGMRAEVGVGDLVLGLDPVGDVLRLADVVFEPAVRVGDLGAVVVVDLLDLLRLRILDRRADGSGGDEERGHDAANVRRCIGLTPW